MKAPLMNNVVTGLQVVLQQNCDIRAGRAKMIASRETYFTRLELQSDDQFKSMVEMAPVYILYPKIVDGFVGTVFSKDPNLVGVDTTDKTITENVDMLGNNIDSLSEKVVSDVFENGFCATINDYSDEAGKAFIRYIPSKDFIRFRTDNVDGYPVISQFIYHEDIEVDNPDNEFDTLIQDTYTVLDLVEVKDKKVYRIRVFKAEKDGIMTLLSSNTPTMNSKTFDYIPMEIHGTASNNYTIQKSPLQDLSDMNISVMQRVVDQVYMLHWTALPTPYVTGVSSGDDVPTTIGPSQAWHIPMVESKVGMLEFSGNSARAHQDFIDNLKDIMASTGAQILKKEGVSRETATSVLVRTAAQTSIISALVKNVSDQIERTFAIYLEWEGASTDDYSYTLNDDFIKVDMEPNAQIALVKSWLDGAISHKSLFLKMKEGELITPNKTFEEEMKDITENPPPYFSKEADAKYDAQASLLDKANEEEDNSQGSNLENSNVANKQATEQV